MPNILIVTITLNSNWLIFRLTDRLAGRLFVALSKRALGTANYLLAIIMPSDYSKSLVFLIYQSFSILFWAYDPFQQKNRKNVSLRIEEFNSIVQFNSIRSWRIEIFGMNFNRSIIVNKLTFFVNFLLDGFVSYNNIILKVLGAVYHTRTVTRETSIQPATYHASC